MGQLIAYGFTQLRRHPLITLFSTAVPLCLAVFALLVDIFFLQHPGPEVDPAELWHSMSVGHKLFVIALVPGSTWIPFGLGQAALAHTINAERVGQPLLPAEIFQRTLRSALTLIPVLIFLAFIWSWANMFLLVPGILFACATGFVPVAMVVERTGPFRAITRSTQILGMRFGATFTLWFLSLLFTALFWIVPSFISPVRDFSVTVILRNCVQLLLISAVVGVLNGALIDIFLSVASVPAEELQSATVGR